MTGDTEHHAAPGGDELFSPALRCSTVAAIVPGYNEQDAVRDTVEHVRHALAAARIPHEIVVVNDGSNDDTSAQARAGGAQVIDFPDIRFCSLILVYLVVEHERFTEYDAHYFPELAVPIARLSEPKNYSASTEPEGGTVLCAELPADPGDAHWSLSDEELGGRVAGWLADVAPPIRAKIRRTVTRRLAFAYSVHDRTFEPNFDVVDRFVAGLRGMLTFGRQGLFAHDTHHALATAHAAVDCLQRDGRFDAAKWQAYRGVFATHVVED